MWKNIHWAHYLKYAVAAAVLYCIPVAFYLNSTNFTQAWLLYLGNFLFLIVIILFLFFFNKQRSGNASTISMVVAGHITVVLGIFIACILAFILIIAFVPDFLNTGTTEKALTDAPANTIRDKTRGLSFMVFANAVIGNVSVGSAVSIIFPFSLKRDQIKEKVPRKQAEL